MKAKALPILATAAMSVLLASPIAASTQSQTSSARLSSVPQSQTASPEQSSVLYPSGSLVGSDNSAASASAGTPSVLYPSGSLVSSASSAASDSSTSPSSSASRPASQTIVHLINALNQKEVATMTLQQWFDDVNAGTTFMGYYPADWTSDVKSGPMAPDYDYAVITAAEYQKEQATAQPAQPALSAPNSPILKINLTDSIGPNFNPAKQGVELTGAAADAQPYVIITNQQGQKMFPSLPQQPGDFEADYALGPGTYTVTYSYPQAQSVAQTLLVTRASDSSGRSVANQKPSTTNPAKRSPSPAKAAALKTSQPSPAAPVKTAAHSNLPDTGEAAASSSDGFIVLAFALLLSGLTRQKKN